MEFDLYKAINEYKPKDSNEIENLEKLKEFLNSNDNCFSRTNFVKEIIKNTRNTIFFEIQGGLRCRIIWK